MATPTQIRRRGRWSLILGTLVAAVAFAAVAFASSVDTAVVDTDAPTGAVTIAPGDSGPIQIKLTVNGRQDNPATLKVYKTWTLSAGTFVGSDEESVDVAPRAAVDPASVYTVDGTVAVDSSQADGTFTLAIKPHDVSTSAPAALAIGNASNYAVTVETPAGSDTTPPDITITTPADGAVYTLGQTVNADYSCDDEVGGSGVASCVGDVANGEPIDTSTVGAKTFTVNAEDNAGNQSSLTHDYSVVYDFHGFFAPVDNPPTCNKAKAGSAIPVKFSLGGYQGMNILASGYPTASSGSCASDTVDTVEDTVTANQSGLNYDGTADQYIYVWKTDKSWAGKAICLTVKLADGTEHKARFTFTK
jgi:hypothetical protein